MMTKLLAAACLFVAVPVFAQTPAVVNGSLETRAAAQSIGREITALMGRNPGPAWVGYAVPVNRSDRESGCWSVDGVNGRTRVGPLKLEGPDSVMVLYRIAGKDVQQIRVASPECPLDAGGLTIHWTAMRLVAQILYSLWPA